MKRSLPLLLLLLLASSGGPVGAAEPDAMRRTPIVKAVEKAAPAVVNIATTKLLGSAFYQDWFGRWRKRNPVKSVGSGVVVHPDGYVVTNSHVVRQATEIVVGIDSNGSEKRYEAVLVAENEENDIALLKIKGDRPFPVIDLGRSDDLMIGEPAIAMGNPFGVGKTVTTGVLSAKGRKVDVSSEVSFEDFLQTDAAINPGNSGGALLNIHGRMIGLNTAVIRGGDGIGFAIPVDRVREIVDRLIEEAIAVRNLGIRLRPGAAGVTVTHVEIGAVANRADVRRGDRIVSVAGRPARNLFDVASPFLVKTGGESVFVTVNRRDETKRIDLRLARNPRAEYVARRLGVVGKNLPEDAVLRGGYGVLVDRVGEDGPAARVSMKAGDLLIGLEKATVRDMADLASHLHRAPRGQLIEIEVVRARRRMSGTLMPR
jgi:S1-C subfamily serine protease